MRARFYLDYLRCDKTTENGEDEIYLLLAGVSSLGHTWAARFPDGKGHWDLNDGNSENRTFNGDVIMWERDLEPGEVVTLAISVMEEDGGTSATYTDMLAALLVESGEPDAMFAGTILGVLGKYLNFKDSDDFIGSFVVRIQDNTVVRGGGGWTHTVSWRSVDRVSSHRPIPPPPPPLPYTSAHEFDFNGDGSLYTGVFVVA